MLEGMKAYLKMIPVFLIGLLGLLSWFFKAKADGYKDDLDQSNKEKTQLEDQVKITEEGREIDNQYHKEDSEIRNSNANNRVDLGVYDSRKGNNK